MKSLKNHFSLVIALVTILMGFQTLVSITQMIDYYEESLRNDYAIVILSKSKLELETIKKIIPYSERLEAVDVADFLSEIKETVGDSNYAFIKGAMPFFYRLKLNRYPTIGERDSIEKAISAINSVTRVETFAKSENKTYKMLLLSKRILLIFALLIAAVAILLIVRQMEVWRYEHSKRIVIMAIFGAPLWLRSAVLLKLVFVDSLVSSAVVGGLFYYLSADSSISAMMIDMGLAGIRYHPLLSSLTLLGLSASVSLSCAVYVIYSVKEKSE
ncbi:MAG: hypothetical protein LBE89_02705 [Helicobacteraceae bacterium]|nr:hypothetical protein [Helicobacteraceae bacterium]